MGSLYLDPAIISDTDFLTLHDQRPLTGGVPYVEDYIIPASTIVYLRELPLQTSKTVPTGVSVSQVPGGPFTEVLVTPNASQFQVNYNIGTVLFNAADVGKTVAITYTGMGSPIRAKHINTITAPLVPFYNKLDNIVADGGVDFTFPNDVTVTGNLYVQGQKFYSEAIQVLDLSSDILVLNAGESIATTVGVEVNRGSSEGGNLNPQLVWSETDKSWNFLSTNTTFAAKTNLLKVRDKGGLQLQKIDSTTTPTETTFVAGLLSSDQGTIWFNGVDKQVKCWIGNAVVILG